MTTNESLILEALLAYQGQCAELIVRGEDEHDVALTTWQQLELEINKRQCEHKVTDEFGVHRCTNIKRTTYAMFCAEHDTVEGKVIRGVVYRY